MGESAGRPAQRPASLADVQRPGADTTAERYAALADWAESAETVTMSAVTESPLEQAWPAAGAEPPRVPASHAGPGSRLGPVSHIAPGEIRARRIRAAVLTGAVLALVAGGVAFVRGGDDEPATPRTAAGAPVATEPTVPAADVEPSAGASSVPPSASPSASAARPSPSVSPSPSATAGGRLKLGVVTRAPAHATAEPDPRTPADEMPVYTAFYSYQEDSASGTVEVVNAGGGAGGEWTVTLTVPGAEKVNLTGGDVRMSQSGSAVTFRPAGAGLPAGGSLTIGFRIDGMPGEPPTGCTINGTACA